jgi:hypothetical protein
MNRIIGLGLIVGTVGLAAWILTTRDIQYARALYRMAPSDPDKYTPGQEQFNPGFVVLTPTAQEVITNAEINLGVALNIPFEDVEGELYQNLLTRHTEGDWGDLETRDPAWAARQDASMGPTSTEAFYDISGVHTVTDKEVWIKTTIAPGGNVTTFYLRGEN